MKKTVETDVAIIGGGIAGLWLLNELRRQGFSAVLLESATLGGGQTNKAQGIIHGGMKYALQGVVTTAADSIADMPTVWQDCLEGKGTIDLRHVPILSKHQYLWTTNALTSKLAGFFAGIALKGNVQALTPTEFPAIFQNPEFKGQVYSLDEVILDVNALVRELVKPNQDVIYKIDAPQDNQLQFDEKGQLISFELHAAPMPALQLKAKKYIFVAGGGNELVLRKIPVKKTGMQRRPLHMVLAKHHFPDPLFAHCLGFGSVPRITITTHQAHDGKTVWYMGGQIAEEGVKRTAAEQIEVARKELKELLPWLDFSNVEFAAFMVERA
jgi:glycerol-3-phosphate dehydrogenase